MAAWKELYDGAVRILADAQRARGELPATGKPNPNLIYPKQVLPIPAVWRSREAEKRRRPKIEVRVNQQALAGLAMVGGLIGLTVLAVAARHRRRAARGGAEARGAALAGDTHLASDQQVGAAA